MPNAMPPIHGSALPYTLSFGTKLTTLSLYEPDGQQRTLFAAAGFGVFTIHPDVQRHRLCIATSKHEMPVSHFLFIFAV